MPFDWTAYFRLARFLARLGNVLAPLAPRSFIREALWRSSVSRAYYAAFCFTRKYAREQLKFQQTRLAEDHSNLRRHLKNRGYAEIADLLNQLRLWRNYCDYDDTVDDLRNKANAAIQYAREVIDQFR